MPPKKKAFLNDSNLDALLAALEAPVSLPVARSAPAQKKISLGNWQPAQDSKGKSKGKEKKKEGKNLSVFHRVMDVLSRGNYASAEAFKRATDPNDNDDGWNFTEAFKGFGSGLAGKDKTRFSEVLKQNGNTGRGMGTLGFALDVFADPLTYAGVGLVGKAASQSGRVSRASKIAEGAKPDVVQLGISGGRAVKNKVTTGKFRSAPKADDAATRISVRPTDLTRVASNTAVVYKALVSSGEAPVEAAATAARIVRQGESRGFGKAKTRPVKTEYSVEDLVPEITNLKAASAAILEAPVAKAVVKAPKADKKKAKLAAEIATLEAKLVAPKSEPDAPIAQASVEDLLPEAAASVAPKMAEAIPSMVKKKFDYDAFDNSVATAHKGVSVIQIKKWRGMPIEQLEQTLKGLARAAGQGDARAKVMGPAALKVLKIRKNPPKSEMVEVSGPDELTRIADARFEKAMKFPPGTLQELRVADDPYAADDLKAYTESTFYKSDLDAAQKQLDSGVEAPIVDDLMADAPAPKVVEPAVADEIPDVSRLADEARLAQARIELAKLESTPAKPKGEPAVEATGAKSVPEILAENPLPTTPPASLSDKLIETQDALDATQLMIARRVAKTTYDVMAGQRKANLNDVGVGAAKKGGRGAHTDFSPIKQTNTYQRVWEDVLVSQGYKKGTQRKDLMGKPELVEDVIKTYRHVEAQIETLGKPPVKWQDNPTPLRLTDFLERLSPDELINADVTFLRKLMMGQTGQPRYDEMRNAILAGTHAEDAVRSMPVIESITDAVKVATGDPTNSATGDLLTHITSMAKEAAKSAGVSKAGAETVAQVAQEAVTAARAVETEFTTIGDLTKALETARNATTKGDAVGAQNALARLDRDVDRYLAIYLGGKPAIRILNVSRGKNIAALKPLYDALDKTEEVLGMHFSTAFGKDAEGNVLRMTPEVKAMDRRAINNANQRSQTRLSQIRDIFRGSGNGDDRLRMWRAAQGSDDNPIAQRMADLQDLAERNGIPPQIVNDHYVRHYKKGEDLPLKLDKDLGWNSWRTESKIKGDVAQHLFKLETAVDKAVVEAIAFRNFAERFGQATPAPGLVQAKDVIIKAPSGTMTPMHPAIVGKWFAPDDLKGIEDYQRIVRDVQSESSELWKQFDKVQGIWKTMATRANPQYYVRNGIGETFINWLNGVPVSAYGHSKKVMSWHAPEAAVDATQRGVKNTANSVVVRHPRFGEITNDMFWNGFANSGARQTFAITDNLTDASLTKPTSRTMESFNNFSDVQEGFFRMAHFIHEVNKSKAKTLQEAFEEAAVNVNRAHGDYADLTKFERKVMKRVIPFYTWQRKVTPALLESALRNPGKVMVYPKLQVMLAQNYGLELDNGNPFPSPQQLLPDYLADGAAVPYFTRNGNPVLGDPGNPVNDQLRDLTKPGNFVENAVTPFVKTPVEMFVRNTERNPQGTRFFGDAPIKDRTDYLADQIPLLSTLNRITRNNMGPGTDKEYGGDEKGTNFIALMNWMFAARMTEVTDRVEKSGEFDQIARDRKAKEKAEKK